MKLKTVQIREFKSIWNSEPFKVDRITCLVGKNEAGKTAILQALYRLNPIVDGEGEFDPVEDYPRSEVEDYLQAIEQDSRDHTDVIEATFELDDDELAEIEEAYGPGALVAPEFTLSKGYALNAKKRCARTYVLRLNERAIVGNLVKRFAPPQPDTAALAPAKTLSELSEMLAARANQHADELAAAKVKAAAIEDEGVKAQALEAAKALGESESLKALRTHVAELVKAGQLDAQIWTRILLKRLPVFMYFDEYYQLSGHDNIQALKQRRDANTPQRSDHPLLGLIELARLDLDQLLAPTRTQELKNKLEGASNHLSKQILKYWSQNKHLRMSFDVRPALSGDPVGMQSGTNLWGEVFDTKHSVSTGLGTRSAGFVWFFSFLAWYSSVKKKNQPVVLLLDEPGLTLHGRAQEDLLRYFEEEILTNSKHQLLYTTHSPFMVDPKHFERVRIVQDKGVDADDLPREQDGTKVLVDVLEATPDSLFPLQGALGYNISQTLFVGPYSLVVEGASDLLYLQVVSALLESAGRTSLDARWTITPVGGADKVPSFVALLGSQKDIKVATLIDIQKKDAQSIKNLYERKLLHKSHVHTFAEFTGKAESDIEDMLGDEYYLELVNAELKKELAAPIPATAIAGPVPRVLRRLETYLESSPMKGSAKFSHYRPARRFADIGGKGTPDAALDRFEAAFKALNKLLPSR